MHELVEIKTVLSTALSYLAAAENPAIAPDMRAHYLRKTYAVLDTKRRLVQKDIDQIDADMTALQDEKRTKGAPMSESTMVL